MNTENAEQQALCILNAICPEMRTRETFSQKKGNQKVTVDRFSGVWQLTVLIADTAVGVFVYWPDDESMESDFERIDEEGRLNILPPDKAEDIPALCSLVLVDTDIIGKFRELRQM